MENTVTLSLEKYHELLDSENELIELVDNGKIKTTKLEMSIHYDTEKIFKVEYIDNNGDLEKELNEVKEVVESEIDRTKKHVSNLLDNSKELYKIKQHWAYKLFIK